MFMLLFLVFFCLLVAVAVDDIARFVVLGLQNISGTVGKLLLLLFHAISSRLVLLVSHPILTFRLLASRVVLCCIDLLLFGYKCWAQLANSRNSDTDFLINTYINCILVSEVFSIATEP